MKGQMTWLPALGSNGQKVLHLRETIYQTWFPYPAFPQYRVPESSVPDGSKGWNTYQKLRREGWILISTVEAQKNAVIPNVKHDRVFFNR